MDQLSIELTNACNRRCLHCFRNKAEPPEFLSLNLSREVLSQAKGLGFNCIHLTGGEVSLYPHLKEFITLVVDLGFNFTLITNGYDFRERLLPLFMVPKNREKLKGVGFSLDGAKAETHDALRVPGSFREVIEAAALCQLKDLPLVLKSVITNFNKEELTELGLLGAALGVQHHEFLHPYPTPRFIKEEAIPSPEEVHKTSQWINDSLARALKTCIHIQGWVPGTPPLICPTIYDSINLDFQGNLVLCCNLSHATREEGKPSVFGGEWLANLNEVSFREGLIRHFHRGAHLIEARLQDMERLNDLTLNPCYWCFEHFGKFEWLRGFPNSPWAAGVL